MSNERVQELILATDLQAAEAAAAAEAATAATPPSPSDSAAATAAAADSSHTRMQPARLTYNREGKQMEDRTYKGDM